MKEKPSIVDIRYEGLEEVTKEDLEEKLSTQLYTILDESTISADLRLIEKSFLEIVIHLLCKGFIHELLISYSTTYAFLDYRARNAKSGIFR